MIKYAIFINIAIAYIDIQKLSVEIFVKLF